MVTFRNKLTNHFPGGSPSLGAGGEKKRYKNKKNNLLKKTEKKIVKLKKE